MKYHRKCETCGHQVTAYTIRLNHGMVESLRRLVDWYDVKKKPAQMGELQMDNSQYTNFAHLRYFGLIVKNDEKGWVPTILGTRFIYGEEKVITPVAIMDGEVLADTHEAWRTHEGERVFVDVHEVDQSAYKKRAEFAEEKSSAPKLFKI